MVMSIAVKVGKFTFSDFLTVFKNGKLQLCSFPFFVSIFFVPQSHKEHKRSIFCALSDFVVQKT
jgi:hypothetical protein